MQFHHHQLDNGLTIIGERSEHARSLALGFFTKTGARDETAEVAGVSHFLEHMLFKGTPTREALEVNLEFDRMGAKYNAFTSEENTVYYAVVLPEYQEAVLDLWSDLMRPALRESDFNTEKGVICEEIAMYKDLPQFDVIDRCRKAHFGQHQCGNSVLGTVESIQALTAEQMRQYFADRYAPNNIVLACAGNFDWDQLVAQAQKNCNSWAPSRTSRDTTDFAGAAVQQAITQDKITREHLCIMAAGPSSQNDLRYAGSVLSNIIGDDTGSRFYWALIDSALADSADMELEAMDGTGAFYCYVSCDPNKTSQVLQIIRTCFAKLRDEGVTEQELQAAKNKIASSATISGELPMGRLVPLGYGWIYRQEYRTLVEQLERIKAVTRDDIATLLDQYRLDQLTITGLGPCASLS